MTFSPNGSNYHDHMCNCPGCSGDYSPDEQAMIEQEYKTKEEKRETVVYLLLILISNAETLEDRREIVKKLVSKLPDDFVTALHIAYGFNQTSSKSD